MIRVACWVGVLALVSARVYDKCELARELQDYGVQRDHISTWVCIAFHESRLDTAAQNHGSGDHGIFQISELFWCGPGKACGAPCSAFRDDDIKDDIKCSLQIYEEHTRLQGNGFLAWVVYPQHCKQNTKKYLAECDGLPKSTARKSDLKTGTMNLYERNATAELFLEPATRTFQNNYNRNPQKPSFLAVSDIFQNNFKYDYEQSSGPRNWIDYKIKNVDDLKLPQIGSNLHTLPTTYSPTTTTTTATVRPIVPWRTIETNEFRNRIPQIEKDSSRTTYRKGFGVTRYDNKFTSKLSIYPKPTQPTVYTLPTLSTNYRTYPTSYPRTTRALSTYRFQSEQTLNLQTSTLPPFPTRLPFNQVSFRRESAIAVTPRPTLTSRITSRAWTTAKPFASLPSESRLQGARPTQSIFDLYLNPTKRPQLPSYRFNSADSPFKLKIFSGGTTTHAPQWSFRGAHLILSYPHFLYADPEYARGVIGLTPNRENHRIFLDLEPNTGIVLRGAKRAQFNVFMRPLNGIAATQSLRTTLTPIFWIEESVLLPEEYVERLKTTLLSTLNLLQILIPVAVAACCVVLAAGVVLLATNRLRRDKGVPTTQTTSTEPPSTQAEVEKSEK